MTGVDLEPSSTMKKLRTSSIAVFCSAIVVLTIFNLPVANVSGVSRATGNTSDTKRYGIVIDAGSSGSRVYVYEWPAVYSGHSLSSVRLKADDNGKLVTLKTEPGLSSFRTTPNRAYASLKPLLKLAASHVPSALHAQTNIYVLATAGMRLLQTRESSAILASVFTGIRARYSFNIQADHVKVISGQMEGVFGWVAVNYALNKLSRKSAGSGKQHDTHGFIEMGGASEQIAYEVKDEFLPSNVGLTIELCPPKAVPCLKYHLYVTTFLGFGANSAYQKYMKLMGMRKVVNSSQNVIEDPCQPQNMQVSLKTSGSQVEVLSAGDASTPPGTTVRLKGTGQFAACRKSLLPLLEADRHDKTHSLGGAYQPRLPLSRSFYGLSEYWYCMEDILGLGGHYDYKKYMQANQKYCETAWSDVQRVQKEERKYPKADANRLRRQCFKAAWLAAVLHDGHHFPESFDRFQSISEINHNEVQWTLGALVYNLHQPTVPVGNPLVPRLALPTRGTLGYQLLAVVALVFLIVVLRLVGRRRLPMCPTV